MKISQYTKEYTTGCRIKFVAILDEIREMFIEIAKFNKAGIKEEFEDAMIFLQLWLYWRFGINGEMWEISKHSREKFMARKSVWQKIYLHIGLPKNISNYVGNYKKQEKVIKHLAKFGIIKEKAIDAYNKIVLK